MEVLERLKKKINAHDPLKESLNLILKYLKSQKKTRILTEKIIELSHAFDFQVIAEGVETKTELDILKELDCDFVQGYYFYRPMPLIKLESIICLDCNILHV